jgi:hypothetical protein
MRGKCVEAIYYERGFLNAYRCDGLIGKRAVER